MIMHSLVAAAIMLTGTGFAFYVHAQDYPNRNVSVIVPFPAGGGADLVARTAAQGLEKEFKKPFVVENKVGAAGILGAETIAKAAPDGHTIGVLMSGHTVNESLYARLPYKTAYDFTPIGVMAKGANILVIHPSVAADTLPQLIALANAKPGVLNFGIIFGSPPHMAAEQFKQMAGVEITQITYKGTAPALTDLVGGHIHAMFVSLPPAVEHVKAGRLKAIAVTSKARSGSLPEVPTMDEAGLPSFYAEEWFALVGPKGMASAIVERINATLRTWFNDSEVRGRLVATGMSPVAGSQAELADLIKSETVKWAEVVKAAKIAPQ